MDIDTMNGVLAVFEGMEPFYLDPLEKVVYCWPADDYKVYRAAPWMLKYHNDFNDLFRVYQQIVKWFNQQRESGLLRKMKYTDDPDFTIAKKQLTCIMLYTHIQKELIAGNKTGLYENIYRFICWYNENIKP